MHLKSYQIDGNAAHRRRKLLSLGLKRQDNDLIVIESAVAAAAFKRAFDVHMTPARLWRLARSDNDPLADIEHEVVVKLGNYALDKLHLMGLLLIR